MQRSIKTTLCSTYPVSCLMFVFILSHFCHWRHSITQTFCVQTHTHTHVHKYRAVQPTFPVWWATSITSSVVEESVLTMRSLCFCASTVEKATAPRLAETTMYAPNTPRPSPPQWQPQPPPTSWIVSLTPTTTLARRGWDHHRRGL